MDKKKLVAFRRQVVGLLWNMEQARAKLNIIQTIVMVLTFVKVWGFNDFEIAVITISSVAGLFLLGWIMDKTHFTHDYVEENQKRSRMFVQTLKNTEEIKELLK